MSDIIKRLDAAQTKADAVPTLRAVTIFKDAKAEIERLSAQVEALTAAATTLLDQIRDSEMHGFGAFEQDCPECAAVKALSLALSSTNQHTGEK